MTGLYDRGADETGVRMIMVTGPNGSGKSSALHILKSGPDFPSNSINADDIARKELASIPDRVRREVTAAELAEQRRREAIASGRLSLTS